MKDFIHLGKGSSINENVVSFLSIVKGKEKDRYFINDIYGGSYELNNSSFKKISKERDLEIVTIIR